MNSDMIVIRIMNIYYDISEIENSKFTFLYACTFIHSADPYIMTVGPIYNRNPKEPSIN